MEDTLKQFASRLPDDLQRIGNDIKRNLQSAAGALARKAELVTREEFEVQTSVLARTRSRLDQLEERIAALEASLTAASPPGQAG